MEKVVVDPDDLMILCNFEICFKNVFIVFRKLARSYSKYHPTMGQETCDEDDDFKDGITNGASWYPISSSTSNPEF